MTNRSTEETDSLFENESNTSLNGKKIECNGQERVTPALDTRQSGYEIEISQKDNTEHKADLNNSKTTISNGDVCSEFTHAKKTNY